MIQRSLKLLRMRRQPKQARSLKRVNRILDVAEQMFVSEGYSNTTTNAIALRAKVSIGSLYQFFPDKESIVQALASRYQELLRQRFDEIHTAETKHLAPVEYVNLVIDATEQFFQDYPGYHAIFMQVQDTIPELEAIESAADRLLIRDWAVILEQYHPGLESGDYEAVAFVLVNTIGTLLWLSLSQENIPRQRIVAETKRLILSYLQSYFPIDLD